MNNNIFSVHKKKEHILPVQKKGKKNSPLKSKGTIENKNIRSFNPVAKQKAHPMDTENRTLKQ